MTPERLIRDTGVSDRAVRLWMLLDRIAMGAEASMPTRGQLAKALDCSPSSVDRAVTELIKAGWLECVSGRLSGSASEYVITDAPGVGWMPGPDDLFAPVGFVTGDEPRFVTSDKPPFVAGDKPGSSPVTNPDGSDQRKRGTENIENSPLTPKADTLGACERHAATLGRKHPRCRGCGTAGRRTGGPANGQAPSNSPSRAEIFDPAKRCDHGAFVGKCGLCRVQNGRSA
jgi:hypothetical protein